MAKNFTWDNKAVLKAAGRVKGAALRWTGKDIRSAARKSMRTQKNRQEHSQPGRPPFAHSGGIKNSIHFAWDANKQSIVVGPVKYKGWAKGAGALEFGGTIQIETRITETKTVRDRRERISYHKNGFANKDGTGRRYRPMSERSAKEQAAIKNYYDNQPRQVVKTVTKTVNMPARPYMTPAMKKELRKMKDRIKRAAQKFKR